MSEKTPGKTPGKILQLLLDNPEMTTPEIAEAMDKSISAVERALRKLRTEGYVKRIGPAKGGYWQVITRVEE
jgi:ATP-dependent DNA helicase RecG